MNNYQNLYLRKAITCGDPAGFTEEVYVLYSEEDTEVYVFPPGPQNTSWVVRLVDRQEASNYYWDEIPEPYLSRLLSMEAERTPRGVVGH